MIELGIFDLGRIPLGIALSSLTLAELAGGPVAVSDPVVRIRREERLRKAESCCEALAFDQDCARAFSQGYGAVLTAGRKPRGPRVLDLLIAATALAHGLPLYTLNADDLRGLEGLIEIVDLG